MSIERYSIIIAAPFNESNEKISDPTFWLPFLPGFNYLANVSSHTYLINLFLSLGQVERETNLTFYFKPKTKNNDLPFTFSSMNKHVAGLGKLIISHYSENDIQLEVFLDFHLTGRRALLLTPLLPSVKQAWAQNILTQVKKSLEN